MHPMIEFLGVMAMYMMYIGLAAMLVVGVVGVVMDWKR